MKDINHQKYKYKLRISQSQGKFMTFSSDPVLADIEEKTEVIYGEEKIINVTLQLFNIARSTLNCCIDPTGPSMLVIPEHPITKAHYNMKERGVRIRFVTE